MKQRLLKPVVSQAATAHRILLVLWLLPLLFCGFFDPAHQSLIAHDEGLYATRAKRMLDTGDWIHPWDSAHHKTPGAYWLLALFFRVGGINEVAARLPSALAAIACILLVYELARTVLTPRVALWSALSLSTTFLWLQYSRFATPDLPFLSLILLALVALLKAEAHPRSAGWLRLLAGLSLSWAFLVRSLLVLLPLASLLPYLIADHRRHRHLQSPSLYGGVVLGLMPTLVWLFLSWQHYGNAAWGSLVGFMLHKAASTGDRFSGLLYYPPRVLINTLPWGIFSLIGWGVLLRRPLTRQQGLLLIAYPLTSFLLLSVISTRLPHYALSAYPFLAIAAGVGLDSLIQPLRHRARLQARTLAVLNAVFLGLGLVLAIAAIYLLLGGAAAINTDAPVRIYAVIGLTLGSLWLLNGLLFLCSTQSRMRRRLTWVAGLLLANWITLVGVGAAGILGNPNPQLKAFLLKPEVQAVLADETVHFVKGQGKMDTLLRFYTPHPGAQLRSVAALPPTGYAWVWPADVEQVSVPYQSLGTIRGVHLLQLGKSSP